MFGKTNTVETFLGSRAVFKGEIKMPGILRIEGTFEGYIKADSIVIGQEGLIKGEVSVKQAVIYGKIEGNIIAEDLIEIKSTGVIYGDILTPKLSIIEGGMFVGKSSLPNLTESKKLKVSQTVKKEIAQEVPKGKEGIKEEQKSHDTVDISEEDIKEEEVSSVLSKNERWKW